MVAGLCLVAVSCGTPAVKEVTETRVVASTPERAPSPSPGAAGPPTTGMPGGADHGVAGYVWEIPSGWEAAAPTPMRLANLTVAGRPDMECYATVLQGPAGGVAANVNRWRAQMGQPPLDAAAIAELPRLEVLGRTATMLEVTGDFTGMSGATQKGFMLLAAVVEFPDQTLFIKMTGPEEAIRAERGRFMAFCQSFKETGPS